jgi:ABC-2 type transport system permease protein
MRTETGGERRPRTAVAVTTARRAVRSGLIWGALVGGMVLNDALNYQRNFPTLASRETFARSIGDNAGLAAVTGVARRADTLAGFVAWRVFGLFIIIGAVWGLLAATRLLRGEEDVGRWEVFLSGRTSRRDATLQALAGLAGGFLALWAVTAALVVFAGSRPSVGFSVSASLFYATALTASAGTFLAVGALASQLGSTRRQANSVAAAVFAVAFLLRMVADSVAGLGWLRWASPLGWVENLHPLTGSDTRPLALLVVLTAATAGAAVVLAGRRDVGVGLLGRAGPVRATTRLLGSPVAFVLRLERWVALTWVIGLAALALVFGIVARAAVQGNLADTGLIRSIGRLGGTASGAAAWIGYEFLIVAALVCFAAAAQVAATRSEEADGLLDNLLARPVSRVRWLAGRLGFGVGFVIVAGLAAGLGGWLGVAGEGVSIGAMLQAGVNVAVPALFVLGLGTLLYGLAPRLAVPVLYTVVLWSFVVEIVGSSITANHWLLDTAVLSHLGPVPAADLRWPALAWMTILAVASAVVGLAAFERRDLAAA